MAMVFLIEIDGVLIDLGTAHYQAHRSAAAAVGWSSLDQATFWRLTRTKGRDAALLPGAKPAKIKEYFARFDQDVETDAIQEAGRAHPGTREALAAMHRYGVFAPVSLGTNLAGRARLLGRFGLSTHLAGTHVLSNDPKARPAELRGLAGKEGHAVVVASSDPLIRAASAADVLAVGIASGSCTPARLQQAGAGVVFRVIQELVVSLEDGAKELIRAGLLPSALHRGP